MQIFYAPDIKSDKYTLNKEESKHCSKVLRLSQGDQIQLIDGKGGFYICKITDCLPKATTVEVVESHKEYGKKDYKLHMAICPTKNNNRTELYLEKATEIGIDEVTPIVSFNSERRNIKHERFDQIIISASKQSIKAYKPTLNELTKFKKFITECNTELKFIAHCQEGKKELLKNAYKKGKDVTILIGPEGDFSSEEVDEAVKAGFLPISLGQARLRTETAGIVACHTINLINE